MEPLNSTMETFEYHTPWQYCCNGTLSMEEMLETVGFLNDYLAAPTHDPVDGEGRG